MDLREFIRSPPTLWSWTASRAGRRKRTVKSGTYIIEKISIHLQMFYSPVGASKSHKKYEFTLILRVRFSFTKSRILLRSLLVVLSKMFLIIDEHFNATPSSTLDCETKQTVFSYDRHYTVQTVRDRLSQNQKSLPLSVKHVCEQTTRVRLRSIKHTNFFDVRKNSCYKRLLRLVQP